MTIGVWGAPRSQVAPVLVRNVRIPTIPVHSIIPAYRTPATSLMCISDLY